MNTNSQLSAEVQLVWEVMTCRGMRTTYDSPDSPCHWFNSHYGPYPAYDSIENLHKGLLKEGKSRTFQGKCVGSRFNIPELLSGCRKAPIMSIGINPNLTAYQTSVDGATWCYPYFDNIVKYAHYFRYRTINQERFTVEFIKRYSASGTEIFADEDGYVNSTSRGTDSITINVNYKNLGERTLRVPIDYELFYDRQKNQRNFKKGDMLAARITLPDGIKTNIIQEPVGYYRQFAHFLDAFKKSVGPELLGSKFQLGEDACQGDMVGCASPGWGSYFPDMFRNGIVEECVKKRLFLAKQLIQTRPAVIVFAGNAALNMFLDVFKGDISPSIDPTTDTYELLKKCLDQPFWLSIGEGTYTFKSRLIFSPHFSYSDNFIAGCRLSSQEWDNFTEQFPEYTKPLKDYIKNVFKGIVIQIDPSVNPWKERLSPKAQKVLGDHYIDPVQTIAQVLYQEYEENRISLDKSTKHLVRTEGPCRFCRNELFMLKEGCPYGKLEVAARKKDSAEEIGKAAQSVLRSKAC